MFAILLIPKVHTYCKYILSVCTISMYCSYCRAIDCEYGKCCVPVEAFTVSTRITVLSTVYKPVCRFDIDGSSRNIRLERMGGSSINKMRVTLVVYYS